MGKAELMDSLRSRAAEIHALKCDPCTNVVWGEGNLDAEIVMVGEAPGSEEDRLSRPFVGPAGKLLDEELAGAHIARDEIYLTGVVKCRPFAESCGRKRNRTPTLAEIEAWREILMTEIGVIGPRVVMCFGRIAASVLIHPDFAISSERGKWFPGPLGARAMATYHPAYLARFRRNNAETDLFRLDLEAVLRAVEDRS